MGIPKTKVERIPTVGGMDTLLNGGACSFGDDEWGVIEWTLPEALHLTSSISSFKNWQAGDHGFATVCNLAAAWVHAAAVAADDMTVDLGANALIDLGGYTLADLYNPAFVGVPVWVEFWRGQGTYPTITRTKTPGLLDRHEVVSVAGSVLTLRTPVVDAHPAQQTVLVPEYDVPYSPEDRAQNLEADPHVGRNLSGGIYFIGDGGAFRLGSPDRSEATQEIAAGMAVCIRVHGIDTGLAAQRGLAITFEMRRPES